MGTICANFHANTFMAKFEEKYMYSLVRNMTMLYFRYIGDTFIIWKGNHDYLTNFLDNYNKQKTNH